ncbi:MAG: penicillin-binding protein activator [Betaproteobacteria bacterium]|nr:penicillin-binding protein activator [Betaproteobacteria bacterium]
MASEPAVSSPASPPPELSAPVPLPPAPAARRDKPRAPAAGDDKLSPPAEDKVPHIALLLPLSSKAFGRHAEAVNDGFLAAAKVHGDAALPVRAYATGDDPEQVVKTYIKAVNAGARIVVGPLTRDGVTAIAGSAAVLVPTLALNVPEGRLDPLSGIYVLSLQIEAEARQVAQLAYQEGFRKVITINGDTPLLKRIHQAFVEEFTRLGGAHVIAYDFTTDPEYLARIRTVASGGSVDTAFLALDFTRARLARPYLGALPVYATSQVHSGNTGPLIGYDLAGVRFLDMPWLLQPDHPAVMVYPRPGFRGDVELDRFYALGIDAFRIALTLLSGRADAALDGVTGRLTLSRDHQFARGLTTAQFADGKLTVVRERP